jgi:anti-sigma regulatory factor (Ser/Thr protein kinase)
MRDMSHGSNEATLAARAGSGDATQPLMLRLPEASLDDLRTIRDFVGRGCRRLRADEACAADLIQAVDESATNVMRHGYGGLPGPLDIEIGREGESVRVDVRDQAPGFDPRDWPEPDLTRPLEVRTPGGLGVHLTRICVDHVDHRFLAPAGNQLTLFRRADSTAQEGLA